jgi:hypothetical protein
MREDERGGRMPECSQHWWTGEGRCPACDNAGIGALVKYRQQLLGEEWRVRHEMKRVEKAIRELGYEIPGDEPK